MMMQACSLGDVLPVLELAIGPRCDTSGGLLSVAEACQGSECFAVHEGDILVMAYALRRVQHEGGAVTWITAAAGNRPGLDLTRSAIPAIEQQAKDANTQQVAITTRRPGLIRKLKKQGYAITGVTLRKTLE